MKRSRLISFLFTLCLILCACASEQTPPALDVQPPVTDNTQQQPPSSNETPAPPQTDAENEDIVQPPYIPEALTVELVVEWEAADALLSRLEDMGELLRLALEKTGYGVERITLTISTAGGFTAESLSRGGVDVAVLPAVDFLSCSTSAAGIAMSSEDIPETVIALSLAKGEPDSGFCAALFDALTRTEQGQEFLALCRPGAVFTVPTEEGMQAVADFLAQQETDGGHAS